MKGRVVFAWWVWDEPWARGPYVGAFTAHGMGGQHLSVLPAVDLVVAHISTSREAGKHPEFWGILDSIVAARAR